MTLAGGTDLKNLDYIRTAKRFKSRGAHWAFFFTRFYFTLSYCPGSHNIKPDALPQQFRKEDGQVDTPSPILPPSCMVASRYWEIEEKVRSAI